MLFAALLLQAEWQADHAAAMQKAAERRAPAIVYFRADNCKRSKALEEGAFADKDVAALLAQFVTVRIDVDHDEPNIRAKYGVRFTPAILFVGRDGKRLGEYEGAFETDAIAGKLNELLAKHRSPWCAKEAEALDRAKKEKRFALLVKDEKPHERINAALGEIADGFAIASIEDAKAWSVEGAAWVLIDASGEKPRVVATIPLKDAKNEELRAKVKELVK